MKVTEQVSEELRPLIDRFMHNSRTDLDELRRAMSEGDLETVERLGHNAKGAGYGYGFDGLGEIGKRIEQAAKDRRFEEISKEIDKLDEYLNEVTISFVPE